MKKNLLLYLFIFAALINVFTYVYYSKQQKYDTEKIDSLATKIDTLKAELDTTTDNLERADYFSLEQNLNARKYFGNEGIDELIIKIRDGVYVQNKSPEGNPLVHYPKINGEPFKINKIKIVNHRWIIADFTDGKAWGEVLIKYFIEDNGEVTYETMETLLHANSMMY
ncbi:hypothetical protein [Flavobacterium litorale]|uniref:Hydrolase n=1 Tax=Flavobacterium litorale TaxID=2856519 RepID=A0ABX8V4S9_9FLAO|nr:hypothetical protein [Flavobacterium litorale]QYJ67844.1 hypothetical protein K1I41_09875 [Flavobacterium litorale]